jgi:hypothetical protein
MILQGVIGWALTPGVSLILIGEEVTWTSDMTEQGIQDHLRNHCRRFWYIGDLMVVGLLLAYITYVHSHSLISYLGGLRNSGARAWVAAMFAGMLLPFAAILVLVLIVRLSASWPKRIPDRKRLWKLRGLVLAGLGLYAGLFFVPIFSSQDAFTLGLRECVRTNGDIPAIQAWLRTVDPKDCVEDGVWRSMEGLTEAEQADWPKAILSLKPQRLCLYLDANRRPVIRLSWSGWEESWGVVVGSVDLQMPKTQLMRGGPIGRRALYERGHYTRPVVPGAYVWYDVH